MIKTNQDKLRDAINKIVREYKPSENNADGVDQLLALFNQEYKKREKELLAKFKKIVGKSERHAQGLDKQRQSNRNELKSEQRQKLKVLKGSKP